MRERIFTSHTGSIIHEQYDPESKTWIATVMHRPVYCQVFRWIIRQTNPEWTGKADKPAPSGPRYDVQREIIGRLICDYLAVDCCPPLRFPLPDSLDYEFLLQVPK